MKKRKMYIKILYSSELLIILLLLMRAVPVNAVEQSSQSSFLTQPASGSKLSKSSQETSSAVASTPQMIDYSTLEKTVNLAQNKILNLKATETTVLKNYIEEAQKVLADHGTSDQVANINASIESAIEALPTVNYTELQNAIDIANAKIASGIYEADKVQKIKQFIEKGTIILTNKGSQDETDQAVRNINESVAALTENKTDKSSLYTAINQALDALSAKVNYTMDSLEYLYTVTKFASDLYADDSSKQEDIDTAIKYIAYAISKLEVIQNNNNNNPALTKVPSGNKINLPLNAKKETDVSQDKQNVTYISHVSKSSREPKVVLPKTGTRPDSLISIIGIGSLELIFILIYQSNRQKNTTNSLNN